MALEGVRDWLVACGATFGCREIHHVHWPDAATRPTVPYMTYRCVSLRPDTPPVRGAQVSDLPGQDPYTVESSSMRQFYATVMIDLYNSEYGIGWLAKTGIAAEKEQAIKNIFRRSNIGFREIAGIEDLSKWDDAEIDFHQRMIVELRTTIIHAHINHNFKVDTVTHSVSTDVDE